MCGIPAHNEKSLNHFTILCMLQSVKLRARSRSPSPTSDIFESPPIRCRRLFLEGKILKGDSEKEEKRFHPIPKSGYGGKYGSYLVRTQTRDYKFKRCFQLTTVFL